MFAMIEFIDSVLNRITMYRLALYYLIGLLGVAIVLSAVGILGYDPFALLFTIGFLLAVCSITNWIFSKAFHVPANAESTYISVLILALIITPLTSLNDLWFLAWAGVLAMASKYIVAINHKHIFNPVAFAVAVTYLTINQSASWWVGSAPMLPFVLLGGILVVRKVQRGNLVTSFLLTSALTIIIAEILRGGDFITMLQRTTLYSPLFFFAFVILTEPLTTPPTRTLRIIYGALVGFLFTPQFHLGDFYATPEIAILIGNLFSYIVSPKTTLLLQLKQKVQLAPDVYDFIFAPTRKFAFAPGQYMEWTLGYRDPDSRGNRRYFTLASSPTEKYLRLGVKFYEHSSTFKQAMLSMDGNHEIVASHLAGDFVLPRDPNQKCVFIAGGIGITPFRSMIKYLLDTRQKRPIVLLYANKTANDLVYVDVFEKARQELGLKTIYTVTDTKQVPSWWRGRVGRITPQLIKAEVPDYKNCIFYISGPKGMIDSFKASLDQLHVHESHIKTDFFSGLA
jgi:ferredoxin-NADP reductase